MDNPIFIGICILVGLYFINSVFWSVKIAQHGLVKTTYIFRIVVRHNKIHTMFKPDNFLCPKWFSLSIDLNNLNKFKVSDSKYEYYDGLSTAIQAEQNLNLFLYNLAINETVNKKLKYSVEQKRLLTPTVFAVEQKKQTTIKNTNNLDVL